MLLFPIAASSVSCRHLAPARWVNVVRVGREKVDVRWRESPRLSVDAPLCSTARWAIGARPEEAIRRHREPSFVLPLVHEHGIFRIGEGGKPGIAGVRYTTRTRTMMGLRVRCNQRYGVCFEESDDLGNLLGTSSVQSPTSILDLPLVPGPARFGALSVVFVSLPKLDPGLVTDADTPDVVTHMAHLPRCQQSDPVFGAEHGLLAQHRPELPVPRQCHQSGGHGENGPVRAVATSSPSTKKLKPTNFVVVYVVRSVESDDVF